MDHMPRLHPDDVTAIIEGMATVLKPAIQTIISKEATMASLQTFTLQEAAKMLNTTAGTLRNHIESGLFPAEKLGKNYIISQQAILDKTHGK